ncbi:DUF4271 domain-containing protein [Winogradskyella sp. A3E31]|uniref:DUF4271 domain-containing protein n=1 Tax=Winogradskyella sp. A3E31 TaxID=3349637 RepID=UPI00398A858E
MREFITYEWFTLCFVVSIIIITLTKYIYATRFNDFLFVVGNSKYLKIYSKDLKFIDLFDGLLFINLVFGLAIFSHIASNVLFQPVEFILGDFLKLCLAISVILLVKTLLERLIGSIFDIDAIMDTYLFQKTTYKNFTGVLLLIFNLVLLYGITPSNFIIYALIGVIIIINGIGFMTSFKNHQNLLYRNFFYFLLYLCALEIGPYVILYKVITEYNS